MTQNLTPLFDENAPLVAKGPPLFYGDMKLVWSDEARKNAAGVVKKNGHRSFYLHIDGAQLRGNTWCYRLVQVRGGDIEGEFPEEWLEEIVFGM